MSVSGRTMFFSKRGVITRTQFAANLQAFRKKLSGASLVCNLQDDRYEFSLGLAAAMLNGQISVLPSSDAPEAILASIGHSADAVILGGPSSLDGGAKRITTVEFNSKEIDSSEIFALLENTRTEIRVFSSGSTRRPECNVKTWETLSGGAYVTDYILRKLGFDAEKTIVIGTTPHRHMFGLEATIFATLGFGYCCYQDTVFYPADLEIAVEAARSQGFTNLVLITSPAHLRFLETTILDAPEICCVISATAPLPLVQAERLEAHGDRQVMEIYGSTETGSMAIRRTAYESTWQPVAGFALKMVSGECLVTAPHLPATLPLGDEVEIGTDGKFILLGRTDDMIGIHGKRGRVSALNSILIEAPGILDAIYLHSKHQDDDMLAIVAVADPSLGLSNKEIIASIRRHLLRHVDSVFVPKRIIFLDTIPRSETGKVTNETMRKLASLAGISN